MHKLSFVITPLKYMNQHIIRENGKINKFYLIGKKVFGNWRTEDQFQDKLTIFVILHIFNSVVLFSFLCVLIEQCNENPTFFHKKKLWCETAVCLARLISAFEEFLFCCLYSKLSLFP